MKADAGAELPGHRPLPLDQRAQRRIVADRGAFFWKPNAGAMKLTGIPSDLAERQHDGRRLGRRQARQLVDREFAQVLPAGLES